MIAVIQNLWTFCSVPVEWFVSPVCLGNSGTPCPRIEINARAPHCDIVFPIMRAAHSCTPETPDSAAVHRFARLGAGKRDQAHAAAGQKRLTINAWF